MPKSTRRPKSKHMADVNRKAFLAINRAGTLESAYMNLSSALHETMRNVTEKGQDPKEALEALMAHWAGLDEAVALQFKKIEDAVR